MNALLASIQFPRDSEANWTLHDPVIKNGALVISVDAFYTGTTSQKFKIGDGVKKWSELDYHPGSVSIGYTPEDVANRKTDLSSDSDSYYPTVKAVNTAIALAKVGLWNDRGTYNASSNAFPTSGGSGPGGAILKGDIWTISNSGNLPGSNDVEPGDTIRALVDSPGNSSGNWAILQNNIGYTVENAANKVDNFSSPNNSSYPTTQAVVSYVTSLGYITSFTETDPYFNNWLLNTAHPANWDTAYGWGNHANAGYLTSAPPAVLVVASTSITNGNNQRLLMNNGGTLGETTRIWEDSGNGELYLFPTVRLGWAGGYAAIFTYAYYNSFGYMPAIHNYYGGWFAVGSGGGGAGISFDNGGTTGAVLRNLNFGIGVLDPKIKLHVIQPGEIMRLGFSDTTFMSTSIESTGLVVYEISGSAPGFKYKKSIQMDLDNTISGSYNSMLYMHYVNTSGYTSGSIDIRQYYHSVGMDFISGGYSAGIAINNNDFYIQTQNVVNFGIQSAKNTFDTFGSNGHIFKINGTTKFEIDASGNISTPSLPTSSSGLSSGQWYNDSGYLKIV